MIHWEPGVWPLGGADGVPVLVSVEPPPGCFVETKSELKNEQCSKPWLVDDYISGILWNYTTQYIGDC